MAKRKRIWRKGELVLVAGLVAGGLAAGLHLAGALQRWETVTWDWRVRTLARPSAAADSVAVILLDQASLDWGEQEQAWSWPWPREIYTAVVSFCRRGPARAVALDMVLTESSVWGVADDELLGEVLAERADCAAPLHARPDGEGEISLPVDEIVRGAAILGNVAGLPDRDGVFRRTHLSTDRAGRVIPSLGLAAYQLGLGKDGPPDATWPVDSDGRSILRFAPAGTYPTYAAAAVLRSEFQLLEGDTPVLDPAVLRGRYVFFGFSAPGLLDQRPTPVREVSPGVMVHATVLDNLLGDGFMTMVPGWSVVLGVLVLGLLVVSAVAWSGTARRSASVGVVGVAVPILAGVAGYPAGTWVPVVPGLVAAVGGVIGGLVVNYATEGRQRRFLKQAFRHYLSPDVVEKLLQDPDRLRLGGEKRELSILFSDLAGFTTISESLEPEDLTTLLNEYLTLMTDIILAEGGTLDKYEGDAIIAFWNAPLDVPDHAARACRTAVLCQRALAEARPLWQERYGCELRMRVGIHTGPVVVGNLGSAQRFDYTVLGDAANLASRLEGAGKVFGAGTLISTSTRAQAGGAVLAREIGDIIVVGRREPVTVFELVGLAGESEPGGWDDYREALRLCRQGEGGEATAVLTRLPEDPVASALTAALSADTAFTGVWELRSK